MGFKNVPFEILAKKVDYSLKTLCRKNGVEELKDIKNDVRRIQGEFLEKIVELARSHPEEREDVLNAAVYFVRYQVQKSYDGIAYRIFTSEENSGFFNSLTISLDINSENSPNSVKQLILYTSLKNFLYAKVYESGSLFKGYADSQPFNSIVDYAVIDDIKALNKLIHALEVEVIDAIEIHHKQGQSLEAAAGSGITCH